MISSADIAEMSQQEKLQTMEAIWTELSKNADDVVSPDWHADALRETEARLANGEEEILDWTTVKRELRNRFE